MTPSQDDSGGRWIGVVTVVVTLIGWCSVPLFLRHFAGQVDAWTSNGWRYGFAALLWMPVVLMGLAKKNLPAGIWKAALVPSAFNIAGQVCFTAAHYQIDPGLLTFGLRLQIVFVTIGAVLLFPAERVIASSKVFLAGMALVFGGTIVTVALDDDFGAQSTTFGVLLAVASGLLFACYGLSVRKYMHKAPAVTAFAVICQYTAAAMIVLMLLFGQRMGADALAMETDQFLWLLVSALIGIAFGHVFYYISIARLGVTVSSGVIQLQPFGVAIGSLLIFGERLSSLQWAGGVTAVVGAGVILWVQHKISSRKNGVPAPEEPPMVPYFEPMGRPDEEDEPATEPPEGDGPESGDERHEAF
ncbi:MAG: DMT family transporter [Phycisphaerales bacterium]|nr:MAG: DMT family transporter [Phycisphaerales bacterium]